MRLAVHETQSPFGAHGETGVVAVFEVLGCGDNWGYRRVRHSTGLGDGVPHHPPLELDLFLVVDVLPLAAGAGAEVGTRRVNAVGR